MPRTATVKKLRPQPEFPLDSHPEVSLDFTRVKQYLAKHAYKKPVLLVDLDIVRAKTRRFRAALPRVRPHFAVKANPDPRVLKVLIQEGAGFEIASIAELDILHGPGRAAGRGLLLQPDEVARRSSSTPPPRAWSGTWSTASRRSARSSRSRPTPRCTCASTRPTSAATGRSRASSARTCTTCPS